MAAEELRALHLKPPNGHLMANHRLARWMQRTVRATLNQPRPVRITVLLGVLVAASSVPIGVSLDSSGYWTNIISNVTGAAVGIPLAVLVLVRVYDSRNSAREKRRARALAFRAAEDFRVAVESCLPAEFDVDEFARSHIELTNSIQSRLAIWLVRTEHDVVALEHWAEIKDMIRELRILVEKIDMLPFPVWREGWWQEVETAWDYLDQVVRPRMYELEEPWLPVRLRSLLMRGMSFGDPLYFQRDAETGLANTIILARKLDAVDDPEDVEAYKQVIRIAAKALYPEREPWGERNYRIFHLNLLRSSGIAAEILGALRDGPDSMQRESARLLPEYANIP